MSEKKADRIVKDDLNDILENIEDISIFIEGIDFEDFKSDKKTNKLSFDLRSLCFRS